MPELWMPGAVRHPIGNTGSMNGGPPRAVHHYTGGGASGQVRSTKAFDNLVSYMKSAEGRAKCYHLVWDPWTGRMAQFFPATSRALSVRNFGSQRNNRTGKVCIQISAVFSPGQIYQGKRYNTLADTPCKGLPELVAWLRSWGIPDTWPLGRTDGRDGPRTNSVWLTRGGHYGHEHVPGNDHTDPGPMPALFDFEEEDDDMPISDEDAKKIAAAVHNQNLGRSGPAIGTAIQSTYLASKAALERLAGLEGVVKTIASRVDLDEDEVARIAEAAKQVAAQVSAADVADRLRVTPKDGAS